MELESQQRGQHLHQVPAVVLTSSALHLETEGELYSGGKTTRSRLVVILAIAVLVEVFILVIMPNDVGQEVQDQLVPV